MLDKIKNLWWNLHIEYKLGAIAITIIIVLISLLASCVPKTPPEMYISEEMVQLQRQNGNELVNQIQIKKNIKTAQKALDNAQNTLSGLTNAYNESVQRVIANDNKIMVDREKLYSVINQ